MGFVAGIAGKIGKVNSPHAPSPCGCLLHDAKTVLRLAIEQHGDDFGREYSRNLVRIEAKEAAFAKRCRVIMRARGVWLLRWLDRVFGEAGAVTNAAPPTLPGSITRALEVFAAECYLLGARLGRVDVYKASQPRNEIVTLATWDETMGGPGAAEAVEYVLSRRDLFKWYDQGVEGRVREVLQHALATNEPLHVTRDALGKVLTDYSKGRLDNVIQTESIAAFNAGRIAYFDSVPHLVPALRFMAVIDARTTDICRERNGLVLALDSPLVAQNTPPLHYRCRSSWAPVTATRLELMARMSGQAIGDYIGGQAAKWESVVPPMSGFGRIDRVKPKPPRPKDPKAAGKVRTRKYWQQVFDSLQAMAAGLLAKVRR